MMHVNYPGFLIPLVFFLFSSSIQSLPCHRAQHLCRHKNQNGSRLVCVFVYICVCVHTHEFASVLVLAFARIYTCTKFFFCFLFFPHLLSVAFRNSCMFGFFSFFFFPHEFICILCQYACFEHNESIKCSFFSSCLKNSSKKLVCKKSSSIDAKANQGKRGICERKKKGRRKKNTNKKTTLGSFFQSPNLSAAFPGGSRDHPSFMICSRTRSLCTFTALVEIRCCGPSSCDTKREKKKKDGRE